MSRLGPFFFRATEKIQPHEIIHIPEVLYHWRKNSRFNRLKGMGKTLCI